ncbi:MAG: DUF3515 family protein [Beutenbergiaceae bacterium]
MSREAIAGVIILGLLLGLVGCARPVSVDPAPSASSPMCADVLIALPDVLAGAERRSTTAQAARSWGDPPIVLRCGVTPPAPTTDPCVSVTDAQGNTVDWITSAEPRPQTTLLTSYGRTPAVELEIPTTYAGELASAILTQLTPVIADLPQDRSCL